MFINLKKLINTNIGNVSIIQINFSTHEFNKYQKLNDQIKDIIKLSNDNDLHNNILKFLETHKIKHYYGWLDNNYDLHNFLNNESYYKITLSFFRQKLINNDIYHDYLDLFKGYDNKLNNLNDQLESLED